MTRALSTEEPCAANVACTVLKASEGGDPFAEPNRALKLMIRQRRNSLFYASTHSAYVASILTSVIATCARAGINALAYVVALQEHRSEVFRNPAAWLPWNYTEQLARAEATRRQSSAIRAARLGRLVVLPADRAFA